MAAYRLSRIQQALERCEIDAIVLYDPINIRYATHSRNMLVWCLHNPVRYCFVPASGRPVLFEFRHSEHLAKDLPLAIQTRPAVAWSYFVAGSGIDRQAAVWAAEITQLLRETMGAKAHRIAFDRLDPPGLRALTDRGLEVLDGQMPMERARSLKNVDEINCIRNAVEVSEIGMARVGKHLEPGKSENELWSLFHATNIEYGGDYVETRLFSSGPRTNPWFQECSDRLIEDGDVVCHDTDMVGPHGYCVDVSRTYFCGSTEPAREQRNLFGLAVDQVRHNIALVKPGLSFREFASKAWQIPDEYYANRYATTIHGIGMTYEWPRILHFRDWLNEDDNGRFEPNMVLCAESYIGAEGGSFGIKHTDQFIVTESGCEVLSKFPLDASLSASY